MNNSFERQFFIKNLYLSAGRTIRDYCFGKYRNAVNRQLLCRYIEEILPDSDCIPCCDKTGCRADVAFAHFIKMYKYTENLFVMEDDLSHSGRICAVYGQESRKFIYFDKNGINLDEFYYRLEDSDINTLKMAKEYFSRCGEYCQQNNDVI